MIPTPSLWGVAVSGAASVLWWISYAAGVAEGEHFALVGILEGMMLAAFGTKVFRRLPIPFLYLFLLAPTGTFLLPMLQKLTAIVAGTLLEYSFIPTFRDGLLIEVPSGSYVVAPGCAGLNFVLASLALSIAYVDLVYQSWRRRLAFVAAMMALAVAGNAVRVYLIILIAHLTDNMGNIVDDHVLYGWGFFSLLTFVAMAIGHRYRQEPGEPGALPPVTRLGVGRGWGTAAGAVLALSLVPVLVSVTAGAAPVAGAVPAPELSCGKFAASDDDAGWLVEPRLVDAVTVKDCMVGSIRVHVALARIARPMRQGKLFGIERWVVGSDEWLQLDRSVTLLDRPEGGLWVLSENFRVGAGMRRLWSVRWIGGRSRRPGFDTMLGDLVAEMGGRRRAALLLMVADGAPEDTEHALRLLATELALPQEGPGGAP